MIPGFPSPTSFPRSKSVALFLAAAVALSSCAVGGPKHSMEELRAIYGQSGNLQAMVLASGNLEHVESLAKLSNDFDRGAMLLDAVEEEGDLAKQLVELLLRYVDNPDNVVRRDSEMTALHVAISNGNTEAAKMLIAAGADVNVKYDDGRTALIYGGTALMSASGRGNTEIVKALIAAGADVNVKSDNGRTALMFASNRNVTEIIKLLRAAGARE